MVWTLILEEGGCSGMDTYPRRRRLQWYGHITWEKEAAVVWTHILGEGGCSGMDTHPRRRRLQWYGHIS